MFSTYRTSFELRNAILVAKYYIGLKAKCRNYYYLFPFMFLSKSRIGSLLKFSLLLLEPPLAQVLVAFLEKHASDRRKQKLKAVAETGPQSVVTYNPTI